MKKNNSIIVSDQIGKKIGMLTVIDLLIADNGDNVFFCYCVCGQCLLVYKREIKTRQSCQHCAFRGKTDFKPNEIVRFITQFTAIPFGEEVIVNRRLETGSNNPQFVVEYKGKLILCRASDLEATGKKF